MTNQISHHFSNITKQSTAGCSWGDDEHSSQRGKHSCLGPNVALGILQLLQSSNPMYIIKCCAQICVQNMRYCTYCHAQLWFPVIAASNDISEQCSHDFHSIAHCFIMCMYANTFSVLPPHNPNCVWWLNIAALTMGSHHQATLQAAADNAHYNQGDQVQCLTIVRICIQAVYRLATSMWQGKCRRTDQVRHRPSGGQRARAPETPR